jgi:hypothetical protein
MLHQYVEASCILNVPQTTEHVQHNTGVRSKISSRWCINTVIKFLEINYRPYFYFK